MPESAKVRLVPLIDELRGKELSGAYSLGPNLHEALGKIAPGPGNMHQIRTLIQSLEWWEFYDVCEALVRLSDDPDAVAARIEGLLVAEGLPYKMTLEGIQWRLSAPARNAVDDTTKLLLKDPRYAGPGDQWQKALDHLRERPPDAENCIKDAVGALEGFGRLLADSNQTFGQLIPSLGDRMSVHRALVAAMSKLYGFRGDQEGVAHGATAALTDQAAEAELVLHWTAAAITFLDKKAQTSARKL